MIFGRWVVVFLTVAVVAGAGCGSGGRATGTYSTVTVQQLQAQIDAGETMVIVDLREPELFRAGHIPGARNVPFEQFSERVNELSPEANIVMVCHTGPMGDVSGSLLAERGYTKVSNLKGGMAAWNGKLEK